jgi:class 3 adenylate cyclase
VGSIERGGANDGAFVVLSEVRYARIDDAHVAYRLNSGVGSGTQDVVLVTGGTMSMWALPDDPVARRWLDGLAECGRLVMFDRRGIGLSDPLAGSDVTTFGSWCDDLDAVVTAANVARPVLVSNGLAGPVTLVYCDRHPDNVTGLVMLEPAPPMAIDLTAIRRQITGEVDSISFLCPSRADEPGFREWFNRAGQLGASPGSAERSYPRATQQDIREIEEAASRLRVPTLVLRRPSNKLSPPPESDPITALVPGAVRVDLPGEDLVSFGAEVDPLLAEVFRFITGRHRTPPPERTLVALLFSDVVASTDRSVAIGDARWKQLIDVHDAIAHSCIGRRGGTVIKTMGDGLLAVLPSTGNALRAGQELRAALREHQLEVRIGIHVADVDQRGDDVSGVGVAIAARILNLAAAGEMLASGAAAFAAAGGPFKFESRGEHHLKGLPGVWPVFAALSDE